MRRVMIGFVLGFLVAAGLAGGAMTARPTKEPTLYPWSGEGARPGLYYAYGSMMEQTPRYIFYTCRRLGEAKVVPPSK